MEILLANITYFFAFFWSADVGSGMQIIHFIVCFADTVYSVDIEGCLVVAYLERTISTFSKFSSYFY